MKKLLILLLIISSCKNSHKKAEEIICGADKEIQLGRITIMLPDCYSVYIDSVRYTHPRNYIVKGKAIKLQFNGAGKGSLESGFDLKENKLLTVDEDTMNKHFLRRIISSKVNDKYSLSIQIVDLIPDTVKYPSMLKTMHKRRIVHRPKDEDKPDSISAIEFVKQQNKIKDDMLDSEAVTNIHQNYYYIITAGTKENVYLTNDEKDIFIKAFKSARFSTKSHEFDMESLDSVMSLHKSE
jgi:hypothetical protein